MKSHVNTQELAKIMRTVLKKGQTENQLTVKELLRDIKSQLESHYKK